MHSELCAQYKLLEGRLKSIHVVAAAAVMPKMAQMHFFAWIMIAKFEIEMFNGGLKTQANH